MKMKNSCMSLYKTGKFFNAYGDDAIILHYLVGYKYLKPKNSVGFPKSALTKVKAKLDDNDLSYEIYDKKDLVEKHKGVKTKYNKILKESLKSIDIEERLERLKEKLNNYTLKDLEKVIEALENDTTRQ